MDGTLEVRPEWKDLLDRVRQGETLTLTEGGRPVARLAPAAANRPLTDAEVAEHLRKLRELRESSGLGGLSWKDLRDEGKR